MSHWESDDDIRAFCRIEIPADTAIRIQPLGEGRHALTFGEHERLTLDLSPGLPEAIATALHSRAAPSP